MKQEDTIILFAQKKVRRHWDEERELWLFSIVDVVGILTNSINPQAYWRKLKERLKNEGNETVTVCHSLKMKALDGKMRLTDVATTEISKKKKPKTFSENKIIARQGGHVAGTARKELGEKTGESIVSPENAGNLKLTKGTEEND